jgi:hypothetical protein
MKEVYIVSAVRTPIGTFGGSLKDIDNNVFSKIRERVMKSFFQDHLLPSLIEHDSDLIAMEMDLNSCENFINQIEDSKFKDALIKACKLKRSYFNSFKTKYYLGNFRIKRLINDFVRPFNIGLMFKNLDDNSGASIFVLSVVQKLIHNKNYHLCQSTIF